MTSQVEAKRQSETITGVTNVDYDLMTTLTNKLEGIAAMEEYKLDCEDSGDDEAKALFDELQRREIDDVMRLKGILQQRLAQQS